MTEHTDSSANELKNPPVKHIMLEHEEYIEDKTEQAETELRDVTEDRHPVVVVVSVQRHLENGEETAHEVKEDVAD